MNIYVVRLTVLYRDVTLFAITEFGKTTEQAIGNLLSNVSYAESNLDTVTLLRMMTDLVDSDESTIIFRNRNHGEKYVLQWALKTVTNSGLDPVSSDPQAS